VTYKLVHYYAGLENNNAFYIGNGGHGGNGGAFGLGGNKGSVTIARQVGVKTEDHSYKTNSIVSTEGESLNGHYGNSGRGGKCFGLEKVDFSLLLNFYF
jgi:hypothetical protein